jgi:hypothetical protein
VEQQRLESCGRPSCLRRKESPGGWKAARGLVLRDCRFEPPVAAFEVTPTARSTAAGLPTPRRKKHD